jgi:hypothetical protein
LTFILGWFVNVQENKSVSGDVEVSIAIDAGVDKHAVYDRRNEALKTTNCRVENYFWSKKES